MADLKEIYGTLIVINLYFDNYSVLWDFFLWIRKSEQMEEQCF